MKERIYTLGGALLALLLAVGLLLDVAPSKHPPASLPVASDQGAQGLLGLERWLRHTGVATYALQVRYERLQEDRTLAHRGNLMIASLPSRLTVRHLESQHLSEWVRRGNHLLILLGYDDQPAWALGQGDTSLLGTFSLAAQRFHSTLSAPSTPLKLRPRFTPPDWLRDIHHIEVHSVLGPGDAVQDSVWSTRGQQGLVLLEDTQGRPALWQFTHGEGDIFVSRYADLFGNSALGRADNAKLLAAFINQWVGPQGHVIFDDAHQGVTALYDPEAFFKDPRLYQTLWFIFAFWLLYLLGQSQRLAPLQPPVGMPRAVDFVRAVGRLYARRVANHALGMEMLARFFNEIRVRQGLPRNGEPVWAVLEAAPRIHARQIEALRQAHSRCLRRRSCNLLRITNLIHDIRKTLS